MGLPSSMYVDLKHPRQHKEVSARFVKLKHYKNSRSRLKTLSSGFNGGGDDGAEGYAAEYAHNVNMQPNVQNMNIHCQFAWSVPTR